MSPATAEATKWTCEGCGVSAGSIDGTPVPMPSSWASSPEGTYCLVCRRERAAEAALDSVPSGSPIAERAKMRRAALIEFEVSRTPDQTDGIIARACRTSVSAVTRARRRLELPDPPPTSEESRAKRRAISRR
jgi:hypothetical protein